MLINLYGTKSEGLTPQIADAALAAIAWQQVSDDLQLMQLDLGRSLSPVNTTAYLDKQLKEITQ